jgi:hypothetical protein
VNSNTNSRLPDGLFASVWLGAVLAAETAFAIAPRTQADF